MKPPSIEFMMIAARGIALVLALVTLAWVIVRWRRDTTRDAQRVFEQLDLVRAELLHLQGQMNTTSTPTSVAVQSRTNAPAPPANSQPRTIAIKQPAYPDFEAERQALAPSRHSSQDAIKPKSLTNAAPRGYEVAARLARNGATVDELMTTCALSRHEAELLVRLHAGMKSMQPPSNTQQKNGTNAGAASRANSNMNQLKNIGDRGKTASKPATSLPNRPATAQRPATHQRVSLVG